MRGIRHVFPYVLLVLAACTGGGAVSTDGSTEATVVSPGVGVDPLVPYSPSPTPFVERTSGFLPDTLTLPTADEGKLALTPVTTSTTTVYVGGTRAFTVYLSVENQGDTVWSGVIGEHAQVVDLAGAVFVAEEPVTGDLHPHPERLGGSNEDLLAPIVLAPGKTVRGALVFHITDGNRPITLRISLDGGTTWGEWATNLGVF